MTTQKADAVVREYNFSDTHLTERADSLKISLNTDQAVLAEYNVSAARIIALQALRDTFEAVPGDQVFMGPITLARGARDTAQKAVYDEMHKLVVKVGQNVWANGVSGQDMLNAFGLLGSLSLQNTEELLANAKVCRDSLILNQAGFAAGYNINAAYVTTFTNMVTAFDANQTALTTAKKTRTTKKVERINKGNALYREMILLAEIGQTYWGGVGNNPAKYDEYVINESAPAPTQSINTTINAGATIEITGLTGIGADTSMLFDTLASATPGGNLQIWYGDNITEMPAPPDHFEMPGGAPVQNHLAGDIGWDNVINTHLYVRNNGTDAANLHTQVNG
ncbi:MAG: hypothetical protein NTX03_10610 [Bacteroidetes bacterium]|nr:hypothetical protein [Bacteroidota bacterium]